MGLNFVVMASRLIVNADDFGLCSGVNSAIEQAHCMGVLTSTTIMAGIAGSTEAVEMARGMPELGVGVHLNLLEGAPIAEAEKVKCLLNEKGKFAFSTSKLAFMSLVSKDVREAIEAELTAQIQWVIDNGIKLTHLDSHKHVHVFPPIYGIVVALAARFGISAIRWPFEPKEVCGISWPESDRKSRRRAFIVRSMARINRWQDDRFIKTDAFLGLNHTGRINVDFWRIVSENITQGVVEVMTHPGSGLSEGLNPAKMSLIEQRKVELEALCSEEVKKVLTDGRIELTHYGKL